MALFADISDAPKVQDQAPAAAVNRRVEHIYTYSGGAWASLPCWYCETRRTERYHYPGLTQAAAAAGAAAIQATLTEQGVYYAVESGAIVQRAGSVTKGTAVAVREAGTVWRVDVQIDYVTATLEEIVEEEEEEEEE